MSNRQDAESDSARPWLDRIAVPKKPLTRLADAEEELNKLREIKAHREWVIDGLRAHLENIDSDLMRALERVRGLEDHAANLERETSGLSEHIANLEQEQVRREAYLTDLEAHIVNLERRIDPRRVDFGEQGILPSSKFRRLRELFLLGNEIRESRPDLARRFPKDRAADFWYWLLWHGSTSHPDVLEKRYAEPDAFLRARVVGDEMAADQYTQSGLVNGWTMDGCLRKAGFDPLRGGRVLDFGVGCGRILQYFALYSGSCEFVGADVDAEATGWCKEHLDFAAFETLPTRPPSPFADGSFDAIYAFSVFSHLPETLQRAWLEDLHRISKPGATLVLTLQGRHVASSVLDGSWTGAFPAVKILRRAMPRLEEEGFAFFPYEKLDFATANNRHLGETLDPQQYGSTFILKSYVSRHWTDLFEIVCYAEAPDDWQDFVVLRRR